jgi:hypothetical protein
VICRVIRAERALHSRHASPGCLLSLLLYFRDRATVGSRSRTSGRSVTVGVGRCGVQIADTFKKDGTPILDGIAKALVKEASPTS